MYSYKTYQDQISGECVQQPTVYQLVQNPKGYLRHTFYKTVVANFLLNKKKPIYFSV